jgi:hypothetical protein
MYYSGIKRLDPLIFGRRERYEDNTTQVKPMPPIEHLE